MSSAAAEVPPAQQARRERILDAAERLATDGGWDAVQMREVAESAGVALGTLYRYFPSKVQLLVSLLGRTFRTLEESVTVDSAGTPQERVYRVVAVMVRYLARHRRLSGAMIRALMTADTGAAADVEAVGNLLVALITAATEAAGVPATDRDVLVAHVIGKVWLVDVLTLLSGRMTVSQVLEDLQATIELVMSPTG